MTSTAPTSSTIGGTQRKPPPSDLIHCIEWNFVEVGGGKHCIVVILTAPLKRFVTNLYWITSQQLQKWLNTPEPEEAREANCSGG